MKNFFILLSLILCLPTFSQESGIKKSKKSKYPLNVYLTDSDMIMPPDTFIPIEIKISSPYCGHLSPRKQKWNYNRTLVACGIGFVGGVAYGYHEVLNYHYSKFKAVHPKADDQFWNPDISWLNKYKDYRLYGNKERFFLSTSLLVWTTDASHPVAALSNLSLIGGTCVITIGEKRKWWEYAIDIVAMSTARAIGFQLIYNGIYR